MSDAIRAFFRGITGLLIIVGLLVLSWFLLPLAVAIVVGAFVGISVYVFSDTWPEVTAICVGAFMAFFTALAIYGVMP